MGRSQSKHEDPAGGIDTGKIKDPKIPQVKPEQNAHAHQGMGHPSTSRSPRKSLVHSNVEAPDKQGKRKRTVPKIVVSGPSNEHLATTTIDDELPETKTIRDSEDYGPYTVHSKPSTIDAYRTTTEKQ
ncbi:spermatogenesis-associated protein 33 [Sphaerodactylus townsendi]|uniref:spermatogenesis-associated protein 33 n=1 Tax=Sphaerodactylus townsendi TaxID=933632 RepID=UPI002026CB22|nr:spermatogenesis-associated protein 33 [Sphaerodactylus townsendi]